jgi:hypothetical protein
VFPKVKSNGKRGRRKAPVDPNASSFDITWFALSAPSSKDLKKRTLGR